MSKKRKGGILTGLLIGTGLGLLFAPKKGSETRKDLMDKLSELMEKAKEIEVSDVKETISEKIDELKIELMDLDSEKIGAIARKQALNIRNKAEELYKLSLEKGTPVLQKAAAEVRDKTIELLNNTANKLEETKKAPKPKAKTKKN
ncbi:MAG: YtxH domain-containing protein [Bacilli bacterium]|nr:YtxH domain-containing protein [Bacilli bacterium]MDD4795656.1 YtxH domain-containing protein [Bacilli bacterium]